MSNKIFVPILFGRSLDEKKEIQVGYTLQCERENGTRFHMIFKHIDHDMVFGVDPITNFGLCSSIHRILSADPTPETKKKIKK